MKTPMPEPDLFFTENFGLGDVSNVYGHSESQLKAAMVAAYNEAIEDAVGICVRFYARGMSAAECSGAINMLKEQTP